MIFVTVGTHEQAFNRLVEEVDNLKRDNVIEDDVFIQTGYSTYEPKYCDWSKFVQFDDMKKYISEARVVITHGGPASFLSVLEYKKAPIVVPRKVKFDEHVNDHQLDFSIKIRDLGYNIIVVDEISDLGKTISNYKNNNESFKTNNEAFNQKLTKIVKELIGAKK